MNHTYNFASLLIALLAICSATAASPATTVYSVAQYGAKGDGTANDGPSIHKAVDAALAYSAANAGAPVKIVFEHGKTYFMAADEANPSIHLEGASNVTIDGKGSNLLLEAPGSAFSCKNSTHCEVRGFTIDYIRQPYTQGTIVATNPSTGTFDLKLASGYDLPDLVTRPDDWISVLEPSGLHLKRGAPDFFFIASVAPVPDQAGTYRVAVVHSAIWGVSRLAVGDRTFLRTAWSQSHTIRRALFDVFVSSDMLFDDMTIYSATGLCFWMGWNNGPMTIRNVSIRVKPGTDRVMSTRRDGIHYTEDRAGLVVEHCTFEGLMDDAINIHGRSHGIVGQDGDSSVTVDCGSGGYPAGDRVQVFDTVSGAILGEAKVTKVVPCRAGTILTLDKPIPGIIVARIGQSPRMTLFDLDMSGSGFVIRNNDFKTQREHAALIRSQDGVIEDNTITGSWGIQLANGGDEIPIPANVQIVGNKFFDTPGVVMEASCSHPSARSITNILLENNSFTNMTVWPITIINGSHINLKSTTVSETDGIARKFPVLTCRNCDNIAVDAPLNISDPVSQMPCLAQFDDMSEADLATISLDWNKARVNVPHVSPNRYSARVH